MQAAIVSPTETQVSLAHEFLLGLKTLYTTMQPRSFIEFVGTFSVSEIDEYECDEFLFANFVTYSVNIRKIRNFSLTYNELINFHWRQSLMRRFGLLLGTITWWRPVTVPTSFGTSGT
jgi:hypothetical protein